jgi:hypothetical protein
MDGIFALVKPQLEYAVTVWDPWTQTNISKIEAVQRRAARFTPGDYRRTDGIFGIYDLFLVCDSDDFTFVRIKRHQPVFLPLL